jgi:hypothetical protein
MLGWGAPTRRFTWSAVELLGHVFEVGRLLQREVGAVGQVPAAGTARSATSAGRSLIMTIGSMNRGMRAAPGLDVTT